MKKLSDLREVATDARAEIMRLAEDFRSFAATIVTLLGVGVAALVTMALRPR